METDFYHEIINNIDQINEGMDWFTLIGESDEAKKIKSTSTQSLMSISKDGELGALALKELSYRFANDNINESGDVRFQEQFPGFEIKEEPRFFSLQEANNDIENPSLTIEQRRSLKIAQIAIQSEHINLLTSYVLSEQFSDSSILQLREGWTKFTQAIFESSITAGVTGKVKCIKPWGACKIGQVFDGVWKKADLENRLFRFDIDKSQFPRATTHPSIFFDKKHNNLQVQKQFELL